MREVEGMPQNDLEMTQLRSHFRRNRGGSCDLPMGHGPQAMETTTMNDMIVHQDLAAQLAFERAENERLRDALAKKGNGHGKITLKITEKGCLGVYGLGRFPVVLYGSQWLKILGVADQIKEFLHTNRDRMSWKD